jgi:hypothetical protein
MNKIEAFKCEFCGKIYANPKTCKSHEKNCYYNPSTRSCASCKFLVRERESAKPGTYSEHQVCRADVDIQKAGLQTGCSLYVAKGEIDEEEILTSDMKIKKADSSWEAFLNSTLRVMAENELI